MSNKLVTNHIVFSDFDNTQTMTKNQIVSRDFKNIQSSLALKNLAEEGVVNLIHCTGRVFSHINRDIQSGEYSNLPFPMAAKTPFIISGVGTEIHSLNEDGEYELDKEWEQKLQDTGFEDEIKKFTVELNGRIMSGFCDLIESHLGKVIGLKPQEDDKSTKFKKSLWGNAGEMEISSQELKIAVTNALEDMASDTSKFEVTASIQTGKIAIDLTPKGANKESACKYLAEKIGCKVENTYMAGDSQNDGHCINVAGANAILVGNAHTSLINSVLKEGNNTQAFFAKPENYAASGVLECLKRVGIVSTNEMESANNAANATLSDFQHQLFVADTKETWNLTI